MDAKEALDRYDDYIRANGNSDNVRRMYLSRVRAFLGAHPEALDAGEDECRGIIDGYVASLPITSGIEVAASAVRYLWTMMFGRAYFARVLVSDFERDESVEAEAEAFGAWLRLQGRLSDATITQRLRTLRQFLYSQFAPGAFSRGAVTADAVRLYVSASCAHLKPTTLGRTVSDIRSYAAFLVEQGEDAARAVTELPLKPPTRARNVGHVLSHEDVGAMLDTTSGDGERELRDRAMLLLMSGLGLRASDVARLSLDDVDWATGTLHVRVSKSRSERSLPLDGEVGGALQAYVVARGRREGTRALFLTAGRERGGPSVTPGQVGRAMSLLAQKSGVEWHGTHSARRAAATDMVAGGTPVKVVADVLGHEEVTTTMRYLRTDMGSLALACAPWPGVA